MAVCGISPGEYYKRVRLVLIIILALNILVTVMKLTVGYLTNSASVVADGYHSLTDSLSNVIALIGIYIASRPRDESHPYGHEKFETIAAGVVSIMLVIIAFSIIYGAVLRFISPVIPEVSWVSYAVMCVTIVINFLVSHFELKEGKRIGSDILTADAMFTRSDILVSLSVIGSLIAVSMGYPVFDTLISAGIAVLIAKAAMDIFRQSVNVLSDHAALDASQIRPLVVDIPGVKSCHGVRTRGRKDHIFIDLHVTVSKDMTVQRLHEVDHAIEEKVKSALPGVDEVSIHIEPEE